MLGFVVALASLFALEIDAAGRSIRARARSPAAARAAASGTEARHVGRRDGHARRQLVEAQRDLGMNLCQWEGDVIPAFPMDSGRVMCAMTTCTYDGEGRNVGYTAPTADVDPTTPPVALHFTGVALGAATRARLVLAASYPWFEWNMMFPPPTHLNLRHRDNGGAWRDRFLTDIEANAFMDFNPSLGGAGAGLFNEAIDLDLAGLHGGDNLIELQGAGTWTGTYRIAVTGVDLSYSRPACKTQRRSDGQRHPIGIGLVSQVEKTGSASRPTAGDDVARESILRRRPQPEAEFTTDSLVSSTKFSGGGNIVLRWPAIQHRLSWLSNQLRRRNGRCSGASVLRGDELVELQISADRRSLDPATCQRPDEGPIADQCSRTDTRPNTPPTEVAARYHERWRRELASDEIKTNDAASARTPFAVRTRGRRQPCMQYYRLPGSRTIWSVRNGANRRQPWRQADTRSASSPRCASSATPGSGARSLRRRDSDAVKNDARILHAAGPSPRRSNRSYPRT